MKQSTGVVINFFEKKGYGFIKDDVDGRELFLHYIDISVESDNLKAGDEVAYMIEESDYGPKAKKASKRLTKRTKQNKTID